MRWYENNLELSELLSFIETLEYDDKVTVANHLLQILICECGIDLDKEISEISGKNYSYSRWYDNFADLSTSMEFLKNLPKSKQDYAVKRFMSEIIMSYLTKEL
ncbi:hypothetical protein IKE67_01085 [bacterium]|nr:hypothetical protein [bacterium]